MLANELLQLSYHKHYLSNVQTLRATPAEVPHVASSVEGPNDLEYQKLDRLRRRKI